MYVAFPRSESIPDKTPPKLAAGFPSYSTSPPTSRRSIGRSRFRHSSVSGFPLVCLISCIPYSQVRSAWNPWGLPGSPSVSLLHAMAVDSGGPPHPRPIGCFVLASCTLKHSPSATTLSRSCASSSGRAVTPTAYRILCLRFPVLFAFGSSTAARLDTGGWLTLTRRGLSPRKIRRAFPGAITFWVERGPPRPSQPNG